MTKKRCHLTSVSSRAAQTARDLAVARKLRKQSPTGFVTPICVVSASPIEWFKIRLGGPSASRICGTSLGMTALTS